MSSTEHFCHRCGHRNPPDANFCSSCGAALAVHPGELTVTFSAVEVAGEVPTPDVTVHIDDFSDLGVLVIKRGGEAGTQFDLASVETIAGRSPDSEIFLDDVTVSRRHAAFTRHASGRYSVRDLGSLNGTYVNRQRITEAPLGNGDEVQIGKFRLVFLTAE